MAPRTVPDTGVLAIGALMERSGARIILSAWQEGRLIFVTSETMIREFRQVMRDVFGASLATIETWENLLRRRAVIVTPTETISDCRDPGDNMVLEAAVAGKADYIVTFDDDLWKMSLYRGILILKVCDFLRKTGLRPRRWWK